MMSINLIVNTARSWLGTTFKHKGRIKADDRQKGGVDCIGLILGVASELGISMQDYQNYPRLPDGDLLLNTANSILYAKDLKELSPSDILLLRIDRDPQHFAIVGENNAQLTLIHSYAPLGSVVEHHLDKFWRERIVAVYSFPSALNNKE